MLFWSLILLVSSVSDTAPVSDVYGNVAYDNGTISWASVPAGTAYKTSNSYSEGNLATLFSFVHGFIDTIQPNPVPFDVVKQVMNGTFDISGQYMELVDYAMGFGICFVIGLLYIIFLPFCGCCFCCCRCCGNCGGDKKQVYDDNEDCKRMGLAQALFLMAILMMASAGCVYFTNDRFTVALKYANGSIADNLDDITAYVNNTAREFTFVAVDMYDIVASALLRDISGIGSVLMSSIFSVLDIDPVIDSVIALDQSLASIDSALDQVISDQNALTSAADALTQSLADLKAGIDATILTCSANCVPTTACDNLDTSVLAVSASFSSLPNLTSTQTAVKDVLARNLTGIALTAKSALDGMEGTINSSTTNMQSSLQSTLDSFKSTLNTMVDNLVNQLSGTFSTQIIQSDVASFFSTALEYDVYRQYAGYGLMGLFCLIPLLNIIGIFCGCCCLGRDVKPTERGCCASCGGCLMILSVAIMFLIGAFLMLLTTLTFLIGVNFEKICQTFFDLTIFKDFIDTGAISNFDLGSLLLNDPNANISIYNILLGCRQNKAPFELMSLNTLVPIDNYLNYSQYMGDIDTQINSLSSSIDLSSYKVLTPDMQTALNDFQNSGINSINFTSINATLSQSLITVDLNAFISAMETIRDLCTGTTRNEWIQHISNTTTIRDSTLPAVETAKNNLWVSVSALENALSGVSTKIDDVLATATNADNQIQNNVTTVINSVAATYKSQILGYIDSYIARTRYLIYYELAACLPLWNLYDSFTTMFCKYTIDALNGFWFGIGWGLLFFVPVIIVSVKLSKYYRKMNKCEGYGDDDDDSEDEDYTDYNVNVQPQHPRFQYHKSTDF